FDVAVIWGSSLQNFLMTSSEPFFLDELEIPYVSLWTDNPIKHLFLLKDAMTDSHKALFVADSRVIEQLKAEGFENVFYLPPWHIDPDIFKPMAADPALECGVGFAATVNGYDAERAKWRMFWDYHMNAAADGVIEQLHECRDHVDTYDVLSADWDAWSMPFSLISHAMYFEQKALVRELVIDAVEGRDLHITGIGSGHSHRPNIHMHEGRAWNELSPVFSSTRINLNCTPWPRSCHHRVFQITACKGLAVTDWRDDAIELYEPDLEVVYFKTLDELPEIIDRYLKSPKEADEIAEAGHRRFLAHHTAAHRMAELSPILGQLI
ncbi:MAG: glycosyltransferase, partial [Rhodospirillales bacterium]|nr:glycosyltransferase [Rhodospirillales bacterium]